MRFRFKRAHTVSKGYDRYYIYKTDQLSYDICTKIYIVNARMDAWAIATQKASWYHNCKLDQIEIYLIIQELLVTGTSTGPRR